MNLLSLEKLKAAGYKVRDGCPTFSGPPGVLSAVYHITAPNGKRETLVGDAGIYRKLRELQADSLGDA